MSDAKGHLFVIQEHHAARLHYDFCIEVDGALKSWAVTEGCVAIQVEDHPVDFASFEGEIPQGEYGAGKVRIWDSGTYEYLGQGTAVDGLERGDFTIRLAGRRLRGVFNLVRATGDDQLVPWLFMKGEDDENKKGA